MLILMKRVLTPDLWSKSKDGDNKALSKLCNCSIDHLFSCSFKIHVDKYLIKKCIAPLFSDLYKYRNMLDSTSFAIIFCKFDV